MASKLLGSLSDNCNGCQVPEGRGMGSTTTCTVATNCLGVEDICFGFGTVDQIRDGKKVTITKINAEHIICKGGDNGLGEIVDDGPIQAYCDYIRTALPVIENHVKCDQVAILEFNTCDEMEAYTGTGEDECPLVSGQIALVQDPGQECFEWYKYSDISVVTDLPGENCGGFVGKAISTQQKWVSLKECLNIPDITANPYIVNIVRTDTGYTAYRSDGTEFAMPFPKGKSSKGTFTAATYTSPADDAFTLVKIAGVAAVGSLGVLQLNQDGSVTVTESGTYSVNATITHFNQDNITTCRTNLVCGASDLGTNSFFTVNKYNVPDGGGGDGPFQQAFMSWTGVLNAGDQVAIFIDNGTLDLWPDPRYTKIIVSKLGE